MLEKKTNQQHKLIKIHLCGVTCVDDAKLNVNMQGGILFIYLLNIICPCTRTGTHHKLGNPPMQL